MSRPVTLLDLRTRARTLANVQNDPNITDVELNSLANRHLVKVYDSLIDAGPPDYYSATTTLTVTTGTSAYALPFNFRSLLGVYVQNNSSGRVRYLRAMAGMTRDQFGIPTSGSTVVVDYVPTAPSLVNDSDTFDGVSGFDELVCLMMARDVMAKRQDDPTLIMANIEEEKNRILIRARHRDRSGPKHTTYLGDGFSGRSTFFGSAGGRLACYRLRGDNIEFFESSTGWP